MHKELSSQLFSMQMEHMLESKELKDEGIALVFQEKNYAVIKIPIRKNSKNIYLRIENVNFDVDPLHLYFVDSNHFKQLPPELYPRGSGIADGHDILPNPIICISSTYSYHTHPSHRNSSFDRYRNNFILSNLVKTIKRHIDTDWTIPERGCVL